MDPDLPYRTRMLQDLREQVGKRGNVDAILVVGDVAFKGDPAEYRVAENCIRELVEAAGCPFEKVFVVPGNHDVDRRVIGQSVATRNAQNAIMQAASGNREREFRAQLSDPEASAALLKPLNAYNDFARVFNCQIYGPDRLFWKQDLHLDDSLRLRLHGLTSVVLSGPPGQDDNPGKLYLSPLQTSFNPVDEVINVAVCHHPPDWFLDAADVDEKRVTDARFIFLGIVTVSELPGKKTMLGSTLVRSIQTGKKRPGSHLTVLSMFRPLTTEWTAS